MTEEIANLLSLSKSPNLSPEERLHNTKALSSMYENPEVTFAIFEILENSQFGQVHDSAAIALDKCIKNNYEQHYLGNDHSIQIKTQLPLLIHACTRKQIARLLCYDVSSVLKIDPSDWPDLINLIQVLIQAQNLDILTTLLSYIAEAVVPANLEQYIQYFIDTAKMSMEKSDLQLFDSIIPVFPPIFEAFNEMGQGIENIAPIFLQVFDFFVKSLNQTQYYCRHAASAIASSFNKGNLVEISHDCFAELINCVSQDNFSPANYTMVFMILEAILGPSNGTLEDLLETYLQATIVCAAKSIDEDDAKFIMITIEAASSAYPDVFFDQLFSVCSSNNDESFVIPCAMALAFSIESNASSVMLRIEEVLQLINSYATIANERVVYYAVLACQELANQLTIEQSEHAFSTANIILQTMNTESMDNTIMGLAALSACFHVATLPDSIFGPVLQLVVPMLESGTKEITHPAIHCIAMLIYSARESIVAFAGDLPPIITNGCNISEEEDAILKAESMEAMALMIRFCPDVLGENAQWLLDIMLRISHTNDDYLRNSIAICYGNLVECQCPYLLQVAQQVHEFIDFCFQVEVESPDPENESETTIRESAVECLCTALKLIRTIYRKMPDLCPENHQRWTVGALILGTDASSDVLTYPAMAVVAEIVYRTKDENLAQELAQNLQQMLGGQNPLAAAAAFYCLKILTKYKLEFIEPFMQFGLEYARQAITNSLESQRNRFEEEEDEFYGMEDDVISYPLYKYLAATVRNFPQYMDIQTFLNAAIKAASKIEGLEKQFVIIFLRAVYESISDIPVIFKKNLIEVVVASIQDIDFSFYPECLQAAMSIFQREPLKIDISRFSDKIIETFEMEPGVGRYYWPTCWMFTALVCGMMDKSEGFDFATWVPAIMSRLQLKAVKTYADFIYSHVLRMMQMDVCEQGQFFVAYAKVLSLTDSALQELNLSSETLSGMSNFAKSVVSSFNLYEILQSEQEIERLMNRIN